VTQSSGRGRADDPTGQPDGSSARAASTDALWSDVRIDPIEIALPGGVGFTLRAYRSTAELTAQEVDAAAAVERDDFDAAAAAVLARRRSRGEVDDEDVVDEDIADEQGALADDEDRLDEDDSDDDEFGPEDFEDEDEEDEEEEEDEEAAAVADEEVPVFLGRRGKIFLFHSPEKLVEFVQSGAEHDLLQLDTWPDVTRRISPSDVAPLEEDSYELDLVVENLRAGHDAWDATLILKAGELARDVGYAVRLEALVTALSPGSPLDSLDDQLRAADAGGVGGFLARRKLKKVSGQQAALGWRTIIGKISAVVDWRD